MADEKDKIKIETETKVKTTTSQTPAAEVSREKTASIKQPAPAQPATPPAAGPAAGETPSPITPPTPSPTPAQPSPAQETPSEAGGQPAENPVEEANRPVQEDQAQNKEPEQAKKADEEAPKKEEPTRPEEPKPTEQPPQTPEAGEEPSDVSPSLKKSDLGQKVDLSKKPAAKKGAEDAAKQGLKSGGKEAAKDVAERGAKQLAKQAAQWIARQAVLAVNAIAGVLDWPVIAAVLLIIIIICLGLACYYGRGLGGKTVPNPAGQNSQEVNNLAKVNAEKAGGLDGVTVSNDFYRFDYLNAADKQYVQDGKIDKRLAAALYYLAQKHNRIAVSHIISGYQDMPDENPESGADRDPNLVKNISAHKDGLAADVSEIDFVYKGLEVSQICTNPPMMDIVYYSDGQGEPTTITDAAGVIIPNTNELLRLPCEGGGLTAPTKEAIPIKASWQDTKPNIPHVSADPDESLTTDPRVFNAVYQPQARKKVHQVIGELLQFPYDQNDEDQFKVTQLITYSQARDVDPFAETIDKLYGVGRPANYGLFAMPESWAQVHIAY